MVYYLILMTVCFFSLFLYHKSGKTIYKIIPFIAMTFFCGFRGYSVGIDTKYYIEMYNSISQSIPVKVEWGYLLLVKMVQIIGGTQQLVFLIISGLTSYFIYKFIDYESSNFGLSTIIYLCIGPYYFSSYNTIRQALAVAIFLYALRYVNTNNKKFISYILFASLFHTSAIAFLTIILIDKYLDQKYYILSLIIVVFVGVLFLHYNLLELIINNFLPQYKNYIDKYYQVMDSGYIVFSMACFVVLLTNHFNLLKFKKIHLELTLLATCLILIPLLTNQFTMIFTRIASYVTPALIVIIPYYDKFFKKKYVFNILIIGACVCYYMLLLSRNMDMNNYFFNYFLF